MVTTLVVAAVTLAAVLLLGPLVLVVTFRLAKRENRVLKSVSVSPTHGYTAEFFPPEEPQSGQN